MALLFKGELNSYLKHFGSNYFHSFYFHSWNGLQHGCFSETFHTNFIENSSVNYFGSQKSSALKNACLVHAFVQGVLLDLV